MQRDELTVFPLWRVVRFSEVLILISLRLMDTGPLLLIAGTIFCRHDRGNRAGNLKDRVMTLSNECEHGQLARSCPFCEYEEEIDQLQAENKQLNSDLTEAEAAVAELMEVNDKVMAENVGLREALVGFYNHTKNK